MLSDVEAMWDGHLRRINVAKHQVELISADAKPINSVPSRSGAKSGERENRKIDKLLSKGVIELSQTERTTPTVFAPK